MKEQKTRIKSVILKALILLTVNLTYGQQANFTREMDSLLTRHSKKPFNGIVIVSQNGKTAYFNISGYSDLDKKIPLQRNDQFVIGSISKQFTAVIVLQELDKKHLDISIPIQGIFT